MRLISVSNSYVNRPFHMGDVPNLRVDDKGGLRKSPPLTTELYFPFRK
jgi:hypothetical protein